MNESDLNDLEPELLQELIAEMSARQDELVPIAFDIQTCFQLIVALQFACRAPNFHGPTKDAIVDLVRGLTDRIAPADSALRKVIAMDWDRRLDA